MTREELLRKEYFGRIERVIDYVFANFGKDLGIDELADVAAFSRFHFHRVFSGIVGETVADFIKRVRLERAASMLIDHPGESVTEIAMTAGFSSLSVFARAFRERFGVTATDWRQTDRGRRRSLADGGDFPKDSTKWQAIDKSGKAESNRRQDPGFEEVYSLSIDSLMGRRKDMARLEYKVEIKDLPELTVAYARHIGAYGGMGEAFERLGRWAGPRGYYAIPGTKSLAVYHDSPETTEESRHRSSACITVAPGTTVSGDINSMTIPGGKFAVAGFEIRPDQFGEAWDSLMGEWFPSSGWQPDDRMSYEVYLQEPDRHPEGKFVIEICEPVRPL